MNSFKYRILLLIMVGMVIALPARADTESAIFAGGCFWCVESDFDKLDGVISTTSGYIGGHVDDPSYKQVSRGGTGHTEAVKIAYDPDKISYRELVDYLWHTIDPTVKDRQFCDHGDQYRTGIFYLNQDQRRAAEASKQAVQQTKPFEAPIVTEITAAGEFYPAEEYHQDYYQKNPVRYKFYRWNCGRDQRLEQLWGDKAASHS